MTRAEILDCLTDRPCDACRFHESGRCERWDCVFEEKPDDAEDCEDAISRQAVLDYIYEMPSELTADGRRMIRRRTLEEYISDTLPSVTPQQKMGWWIKVVTETDSLGNETYRYECSECGFFAFFGTERYCPYCGAKMVEPQESEDNE